MPAPVRTCIGCRETAPSRELVRLHVEGGVVVGGRGEGRGAWLHPRDACLEQAVRRRAFVRAFRDSSVRADPRVLRDLLTGNARKD
jgi:predicted RNA-binding protein YlxR (DUF448 family)